METKIIVLEDCPLYDIPKVKMFEAAKIQKIQKLKQNEKWFDKFNKKRKR